MSVKVTHISLRFVLHHVIACLPLRRLRSNSRCRRPRGCIVGPLELASRPGANIKFYSRSIRFRKPEGPAGSLERSRGQSVLPQRSGEEGRRGEKMRRIFCVKRRERRCCHRVYRVDRAPRGGPVFYYLRRGPFKARCLGTNGAVLKSGGLTDANKRSERKLVRVRGRARVRLYTRTTGPTAFYGFLTDHISRRRTTSRAPFVLSNKLANLHACTHATARAERSSHRHPTGVSRINLPPLAAAERRLEFSALKGGSLIRLLREIVVASFRRPFAVRRNL